MKSIFILLVFAILFAASSENLLGDIKKKRQEIIDKFKACIEEKGSNEVKAFYQNSKDIKYVIKNASKMLKSKEDRKTIINCNNEMLKQFVEPKYKKALSLLGIKKN